MNRNEVLKNILLCCRSHNTILGIQPIVFIFFDFVKDGNIFGSLWDTSSEMSMEKTSRYQSKSITICNFRDLKL